MDRSSESRCQISSRRGRKGDTSAFEGPEGSSDARGDALGGRTLESRYPGPVSADGRLAQRGERGGSAERRSRFARRTQPRLADEPHSATVAPASRTSSGRGCAAAGPTLPSQNRVRQSGEHRWNASGCRSAPARVGQGGSITCVMGVTGGSIRATARGRDAHPGVHGRLVNELGPRRARAQGRRFRVTDVALNWVPLSRSGCFASCCPRSATTSGTTATMPWVTPSPSTGSLDAPIVWRIVSCRGVT